MWFKKNTNSTFQPIAFGDYLIKEITPQEWQAFRLFYLHALKDSPASSSDSYEEKKDEDAEHWQREVTESWDDPRSLLCAVIHKPSNKFIGIIRISGNNESKLSHEAHVRACYLDPQHHEDKLARFVWQSLIKYFQQFTDIRKLKAVVLTSDREAISLFNELGFVRYGYDETYFRIGRKYADAILMMKRL